MSDIHRFTGRPGSFARGLRVQLDVIGALLMREIHTRYGRDNVGYLWMFLEPMTLAVGVALLHSGQHNPVGTDIHPIPLGILGYTLFIMFRGMVTRAEGAIESNSPLLYHRTVTVFDMMASRALLEGAAVFVTFIVMVGFSALLGITHLPARPIHVLIACALMFWFGFAVSMIVVGWTHENRMAARLIHPMTYLLMPLSGGFYQMKWLPEPYRGWLEWFPMTSIFEELRYGHFYDATDRYAHVKYTVFCCLLLTYYGIVWLRVTRRHVHLS